MNIRNILSIVWALSLTLSSPVFGEKLIPAEKDTQDPTLFSIGPIGVRVKTDHLAPRHPRSKSSSATVAYIFENSLAQGKLELGDLITGVNGEPFKENFTAKLAEEINKSEGGSGNLVLDIERKDQKKQIIFELKNMGTYSDEWPYKCEKSAQILQDACDWLVAHQQANGRLEKGNDTTFVLSSVGGLAMLGCDRERYKEPLEKLVQFHVNYLKTHTNSKGHYQNGTLELWSLNYAAIFLAEYYLATNDKRVFGTLEFLDDEIYHRQFHQADTETIAHITALRKRRGDTGEPVPKYWFSHAKIDPHSTGYIHLGANVANACVAWSLLHEAGVDVDLENFEATKDYIEKACTVGTMGYAARIGQASTPGDAFGRTGTLGIAMYLDGNRTDYEVKVKGALNRLYPRNIYFSHATCVMGKTWGILAAAQQDPELFRQMMDDCRDDFDLLRLSDGSFVSNPVPKNLHAKLDLLFGGNKQKHRWTTAFNALIYALGEKRLRIAGREPS